MIKFRFRADSAAAGLSRPAAASFVSLDSGHVSSDTTRSQPLSYRRMESIKSEIGTKFILIVTVSL
jgi:hypothetical protein